MASVSVGTQTTVRDIRSMDERSKASVPAPVNTGRLVYANPQDLPSFPSLGLKKDDAAAGAAASLGWANARPLTLWTPEKDASAQRAASLANDYKMPALPQPQRTSAGSVTAAVLAAGNAIRTNDGSNSASRPASAWGSSAATQAFAAAGGSGGVEPREVMTPLNRRKSLRAAKDAFAGQGRPRSLSSPLTYPDSANAAANALSAATIAHRPNPATINLRMTDVGAQPVTTMGSAMYTSNPPVKPEVDEKNRDEALHASAVAMAKKMFALQQKNAETAKRNADRDVRPGSADSDDTQQPMPFTNLQDAAYKLAQERLAPLHEEYQRRHGMADYYGTSKSPTSPGRKLTKFTSVSKLRRRASSDGVVAGSPLGSDDDRQRSRHIRNQMSLFSNKIDQVDQSKRSRDREALLAAAQRNVKTTLEGMDDKMYLQQGRVPPSKLNEWEAKAHVAAQARSDARMTADKSGMVDLGAGQYMDQDKVNEIAARRVQPVLDEINEKAELERQRIAAQKEEQEKKKLEAEAEKQKIAAAKEDTRRLKEEERLRKDALKDESKARRAEEKRLAKEEKDKNKGTVPRISHDGAASAALEPKLDEAASQQPKPRRLSRPLTPKIQTKTLPLNKQRDDHPLSPETSPDSAGLESHSSRVKNWFKSRLQRPRAKSNSNSNTNDEQRSSSGPGPSAADASADASVSASAPGPSAFIGGHTLARLHGTGTNSLTSLSESGTGTGGEHRSASIRDVALAGRPTSTLPVARVGVDEEGESSSSKRQGQVLLPSSSNTADDLHSLSSAYSSEGGGAAARESRARTRPTPLDSLAEPPAITDPARVTGRISGSPDRGSRFVEIID